MLRESDNKFLNYFKMTRVEKNSEGIENVKSFEKRLRDVENESLRDNGQKRV